MYSTISLLLTLFFLIALTHWNRWRMNKLYGAILMAWYLAFLVLSSLYELGVFGDRKQPTCPSNYWGSWIPGARHDNASIVADPQQCDTHHNIEKNDTIDRSNFRYRKKQVDTFILVLIRDSEPVGHLLRLWILIYRMLRVLSYCISEIYSSSDCLT